MSRPRTAPAPGPPDSTGAPREAYATGRADGLTGAHANGGGRDGGRAFDGALPPSPGPVDLCGVRLAGPIVNGSGTFDALAARRAFGDELLERFPFHAFVSKTITLAPRAGNPPPRLWEAPAGLVNSIGLPNKGLEAFLDRDLPELVRLPVPLIVSVMGFDRDELAQLVAAAGARPEVSALELNFSCPNVETGLEMGAEPSEAARAVEHVRARTEMPLLVKLSPSATDPAAVAAAAESAGADGIVLVNTLRGSALDPRTRRPWLGGGGGGLSGPAVRALALGQVARVAQRVAVPVVGMGGVASGAHAADLLSCGATLVGVGTESFRDPAAGRRVASELAAMVAPSDLDKGPRTLDRADS